MFVESRRSRTLKQRPQSKHDRQRLGVALSGSRSSFGPSSSLAGQQNLEPVAPLELSANRRTPATLTKKGQLA